MFTTRLPEIVLYGPSQYRDNCGHCVHPSGISISSVAKDLAMHVSRFALLFCGLASVSSLAAAEEQTEFTELDAALKQAEKTGKPVFVYAFDSI